MLVRTKKRLPRIGWREWAALPDLGVPRIKVKVDTGARSSTLHAFDLVKTEIDGRPWVRFSIHPNQRDSSDVVEVEAPMADERWVRSSTGKRTLRPVIRTTLCLGSQSWTIELTLVRRDRMGFRMLLGRQAIRGHFLVHSGRSFLAAEPTPQKD